MAGEAIFNTPGFLYRMMTILERRICTANWCVYILRYDQLVTFNKPFAVTIVVVFPRPVRNSAVRIG